MKNLKRILSLALASVMVMGMMVVGASAADFNDQDQIKHTEAVNTLVALKVLSGKEGNNFDPTGTLTRAEMATMASVVLNRGVAPKFATKPTPTYTDIDNHWAESYIEYCTAFGIVGGIGGNKFDPEGTLTATQAARILLNAMGYTVPAGADWALTTEIQARDESIDLYKDIDTEILDPSKPITRDQAAQMMCNALNAPMVDAQGNTTSWPTTALKTVETGKWLIKPTATGKANNKLVAVANAKYNTSLEALLTATSDSVGATLVTDFTIEAETEERWVTTTGVQTLGNKYLATNTAEGYVVGVKANNKAYDLTIQTADGAQTFEKVENYERFMGQNVKVLYKSDKDASVYGVFASGSSVLFEGTVEDYAVDGEVTKLAGKAVKVAKTAATIAYNKGTTTMDVHANYSKLTAIDNTGNGAVDVFMITPVVVEKVTYVGSTYVAAGSTYTFKDNDIESGLKANDWVTIAESVDGGSKLTKIEKIANVTATSRDKDNNVYIGGKTYREGVTDVLASIELGKSYDLIVVNGYVFSATAPAGDETTVSVDDVVYALEVGPAAPGNNDLDGKTGDPVQKIRVLRTDGTKAVITVSALNPDPNGANDAAKNGTLDEWDGEADATGKNVVTANNIFVATENKDGTYTLTDVALKGLDDTDVADYNVAAGKAVKDGEANIRFNETDLFFVNVSGVKGDKVKVMTGKEVNAWNEKNGTDLTSGTLFTSVAANGLTYASFGVMHITGTAWPGDTATVSSMEYGYLTADYKETYINDGTLKGTYLELSIWNGVNNVTLFVGPQGSDGKYKISEDGEAAAAELTLTGLTAGARITYTEGANKVLASLKDITATAAKDIVTAYDGKNAIAFEDAKEYSLENTVVIYIDDKECEGKAEGVIQLASGTVLEDVFIYNVYPVIGKNDKNEDVLKALYVDVNNALNDGEQIAIYTVTRPASITLGTGDKAPADGYDISKATIKLSTVNGKESDEITLTVSGVTLGSGNKLTLTSSKGTVTAAADGSNGEKNWTITVGTKNIDDLKLTLEKQ